MRLTTYASVLPLPVLEAAMMSLPASACGMKQR